MSVALNFKSEPFTPPPSPGADTGGCRQDGGGTFFQGFVDWELLPFLKSIGLTAEERAAIQVVITMAEYDEELDAYFVEWNVAKVCKRSATSPKVSQRAKAKLEKKALAFTVKPARKGKQSAVVDITNLIRAKGKKNV